jgi:AcrR family transcriptional regulator
MLFARMGYEQTSTAAIARESGSSESQLIRYFGGKAGLLEAIFNDSWNSLTEGIALGVSEAKHGRDAILRILGLMIEAFSRDHETAFLFLFEGRRIRGNAHEVVLSKGFLQFYELVRSLIQRAQADGSIRADLNYMVLASALLGTAEGMIRDRLLAERSGTPELFGEHEIRATFEAVVNGLRTSD